LPSRTIQYLPPPRPPTKIRTPYVPSITDLQSPEEDIFDVE